MGSIVFCGLKVPLISLGYFLDHNVAAVDFHPPECYSCVYMYVDSGFRRSKLVPGFIILWMQSIGGGVQIS